MDDESKEILENVTREFLKHGWTWNGKALTKPGIRATVTIDEETLRTKFNMFSSPCFLGKMELKPEAYAYGSYWTIVRKLASASKSYVDSFPRECEKDVEDNATDEESEREIRKYWDECEEGCEEAVRQLEKEAMETREHEDMKNAKARAAEAIGAASESPTASNVENAFAQVCRFHAMKRVEEFGCFFPRGEKEELEFRAWIREAIALLDEDHYRAVTRMKDALVQTFCKEFSEGEGK